MPDTLFKKAKIKAAERGISMKALVIESLAHTLEMEEAVRKKDAEKGFAANHHGWPVLSKKKGVKVTETIINNIKEEIG
ncbi:antitoxin [Leptospira yasudae]|uniref:antitoxin n=1 Tax=Leptospira yasudae TaxID=2202201 RepID=UPI001F4EC63F|nr:antitoxin [Leptospira yasudae]